MGINVKEWAKASASGEAPTSREITASVPPDVLERARSLRAADGRPGRVLHPFKPPRVASPWAQQLGDRAIQRRIAAAPVKRVPLSSLVSNGQRSIKREVLESHLANPGQPGADQGGRHPVDHPIIVKVNGQSVVYDGHTRAAAAWCRGEAEVEARVVDLDGPEPLEA